MAFIAIVVFFLPPYLLPLFLKTWQRVEIYALAATLLIGAFLVDKHHSGVRLNSIYAMDATLAAWGAFLGCAGRAITLWLAARGVKEGFVFMSYFLPLPIAVAVLAIVNSA